MIRKFLRLRSEARAQYRLENGLHGSFHQQKAIFIHVPKAAGSSISLALFGHQVGHFTIHDWYRRDFCATESYFKFTFVREPLDRLHSAFHFLKAGGMNEKDREFARRQLDDLDFPRFVRRLADDTGLRDWMHFRPQHAFVCTGSPPTRLLVNFVGRFEQIETDFARVVDIIGSSAVLKHINSQDNRGAWVEAISRETKQLVEKIYAEDYQFFGY